MQDYTQFFKQTITAGWNVRGDGHVEAPTGYFALIEVPPHQGEFADLMDAVFDTEKPENIDLPPVGWYVTVENDQGILRWTRFPSKTQAKLQYERLVKEFIAWDTEDGLVP